MKRSITGLFCLINSATAKFLLLALAICAPADAVYAQSTMTKSGGDNQNGPPNSTLANPLSLSFSGFSYATSLVWTVTSGSATFQQSGTTTYSDPAFSGSGSTFTPSSASVNLVLGGTPGPVTVTATFDSTGCNNPPSYTCPTQTATFNEFVNSTSNTISISGGNNQSAYTNFQFSQPLTVSFSGYPVGSTVVFLDWQVTSNNATFQESGTSTYANSNGVATSPGSTSSVHLIAGPNAGPVTVTATCSGGCTGSTQYVTFNETINTPPPNLSMNIVSGDGQTGQPNTTLPLPLTVSLRSGPLYSPDSPNATLTWQVVGGTATFGTNNATTYTQTIVVSAANSTYRAQVPLNLGATPGTVTVNVTCDICDYGFKRVFRNTIAATGGGSSGLPIVSGNGQSGVVGSPASTPLVVQSTIPDPATGSLAGQTVSWAVVSGSATLSGATSQTDANGQATMNFSYGSSAGPIVITATLGNVTSQFTETAFVPTNTLGGNNQAGQPGAKLQPFTIQLQGPGGTTTGLGGIVVNWTVLQGGGTLASATTTTDAAGKTSNTLTLGTVPGTNVVQATIPGVGTFTFTASSSVTIPGNVQFTLVSGNNQALIPGTNSQPLVVKLLTGSGTPIPGAVVQWSATPNQTATIAATSTTDANGQAQNIINVVLPGSYTVTAQLQGAPNVPALTFNFGNGVANLPTLTGTQIGVAQVIDKACPALAAMPSAQLTAPQRDFLARCSEVVVASSNNPQQVPGALSAMTNNKSLPQSQLANSVGLSQYNNLNIRLAELRQGARGFSAGGLALVNDGKSLPLAMLGKMFDKDPQQKNDEVGKDFERWGFFLTGMVERGGYDADNTRPGFDFHNASLTGGVDYRFSDSFVAGAALGYNRNNSSLNANLGKLDANGWSLNGYFTWYHNNAFYVEGSLVLDWLNYDLSRNIVYQIASVSGGATTSVNQTVEASPDGHQTSLSLSIGKDFNHGAWSVSPYVRGIYTHLNLSGFSETARDPNAPGAGLITAVDSRSRNSELAIAGARLSYTTSFDWGVLVPNAVLEMNHEFKNDPQTVVVRFLADPTNTPISLTDPAQDNNYFNIGIGLNAVLPKGRSGFLLWEHLTGFSGAHENRYSIGIRIEF